MFNIWFFAKKASSHREAIIHGFLLHFERARAIFCLHFQIVPYILNLRNSQFILYEKSYGGIYLWQL